MGGVAGRPVHRRVAQLSRGLQQFFSADSAELDLRIRRHPGLTLSGVDPYR